MFRCEVDVERKAFLEMTAHTFRVPNEMADAEGGEVLAGIPGSQPRNSTGTFVFPNPAADAHRFRAGKGDRFRLAEKNEKDAGRAGGRGKTAPP